MGLTVGTQKLVTFIDSEKKSLCIFINQADFFVFRAAARNNCF